MTTPTPSDSDPDIHITLTEDVLDLTATAALVRSPKAGAIVLFVGTTRDTFDGQPVKTLSYSTYYAKAQRTMALIAHGIKARFGLTGIAITHRLGEVGVGEDSVHIAVASPHRQAAFDAGREALEEIKKKAEIWKLEVFQEGGGVWRSNRDGEKGVRVDDAQVENVIEAERDSNLPVV
ncbi:molybdopterin synthase large subunit [Tricharina praecox]|uniref:molybdopterin synthase large subunit n=1 Tax=Tricharina praecox TaxID=43433 RepID=UPI00221FB756|nr:molybdopterin synthase large subunit [Tricharina praecox]KAI5844729.1 molybdopterin synthase large subunit [Tricharina praecox]